MSPFVFGQFGSITGGGGSPPTPPNEIRIDFTSGTSFPLTLKSFAVGGTLRTLTINYDSSFDGGANFTVGVASDNDKFVQAGETTPASTDEFQFPLYFNFTSPETVSLYLDSGAPTTGSGFVVVEFV